METPPILDYSEKPLPWVERRTLAAYLRLHEKPPTVLRLLSRAWMIHSFVLLWGAGSVALLWWVGTPNGAMLVAGLIAGSFLRDLGQYRRTVRFWPLMDRILNWDRIHQLAGRTQGQSKVVK